MPMIIGFIWYNPKLLGEVWAREARVSEEMMKSSNIPMVYGISFLLSVMLAFSLAPVVIHQLGVMSMLEGAMRPTSPNHEEAKATFDQLMATYGTAHRHFGHGALHGAIAAIFLVFPILGTNALFERKSWKYIWLNVGYWTITLAIMGGIVCQFYQFP